MILANKECLWKMISVDSLLDGLQTLMTLFTPRDSVQLMDNLPCWPDKHMYFHSMELYYYECKVQILFCTKIQLSQVLYWICSGPQVFVFSSISAKIETLP